MNEKIRIFDSGLGSEVDVGTRPIIGLGLEIDSSSLVTPRPRPRPRLLKTETSGFSTEPRPRPSTGPIARSAAIDFGDSLPDADSKQMLKKKLASLEKSVKCIKVLSNHLKDKDQLVTELEKEVKNLKLAIEYLQSRLHRNNLDSSVKLKEKEIFIPGHDKEILKDLLNEIIRLRKIIDAKYSSEEVAEAQSTIEGLQEKVSELFKGLTLKEKELADHLNDMKASDNEKNALISKLKVELRECYKQREHDDEVRLTLSREVEQIIPLKKKMNKMAKEIEEYEELKKLRTAERKMLEEQRKCLMKNDSGLSLEEECKSVKEQARSLSRENTELSKQLRDVMSMNTRWQKYSDQREGYVVELTRKNQIKMSENKVLEGKCQELVRKIDELDKMVKQKDIKLKEKSDAAVIGFQAELSRSERQNQQLQERIATLERQLQENKLPSSEQSERIMLLEHQVKSVTEDFELERKDRTNLQQRYQELLEKNNRLSDMVTNYNQAMYHTSQYQKQSPQYQNRSPQCQQQLRFDPYSFSSRCGFEQAATNQQNYLPDLVEVDGDDFADSAETTHKSKNTSPLKHADDNIDGSLEEDELLRCPRCYKVFKVMEHAQLINHLDICDGNADDVEIG